VLKFHNVVLLETFNLQEHPTYNFQFTRTSHIQLSIHKNIPHTTFNSQEHPTYNFQFTRTSHMQLNDRPLRLISHLCLQRAINYQHKIKSQGKFFACSCTVYKSVYYPNWNCIFLISNFRRVLYVVCFLWGNPRLLNFYMLTFRNTLPVPSSPIRLWRWNRVFRNVGI